MSVLGLVLTCLWSNFLYFLLWTALGASAGLLLGVYLAHLCHRRLTSKGWLEIGFRYDRQQKILLASLWWMGLPIALIYTCVVFAWAFGMQEMVVRERVLDFAGRTAFRAVTATVLAHTSGSRLSRDERVELAREYLEKGKLVPIDDLARRFEQLPETLAQDACLLLRPDASEWSRKITLRGSRMIVSSGLDHNLGWVQALISDLRSLPSEKPGFATCDQIAGGLCRIHFEPQVRQWVFFLIAAHALLGLLIALKLVSLPLLGCCVGRRIVRRRAAARTRLETFP